MNEKHREVLNGQLASLLRLEPQPKPRTPVPVAVAEVVEQEMTEG